MGQMKVEVTYGTQIVKLPLILVSDDGPSLFGWDWMMKIQLNWKEIYTVTSEAKVNDLTAHCFNQDWAHLRTTRLRFMWILRLSQNSVKHGRYLIP